MLQYLEVREKEYDLRTYVDLYTVSIYVLSKATSNFLSINNYNVGPHAKCDHVYVGWLHSEYVKIGLETWQDSHSKEPAISGVLVYVHRDAFMFKILS